VTLCRLCCVRSCVLETLWRKGGISCYC